MLACLGRRTMGHVLGELLLVFIAGGNFFYCFNEDRIWSALVSFRESIENQFDMIESM